MFLSKKTVIPALILPFCVGSAQNQNLKNAAREETFRLGFCALHAIFAKWVIPHRGRCGESLKIDCWHTPNLPYKNGGIFEG